jgi:hypothetical protein
LRRGVRRVEARYAKGQDMSKLKIRVGEVEVDILGSECGVCFLQRFSGSTMMLLMGFSDSIGESDL